MLHTCFMFLIEYVLCLYEKLKYCFQNFHLPCLTYLIEKVFNMIIILSHKVYICKFVILRHKHTTFKYLYKKILAFCRNHLQVGASENPIVCYAGHKVLSAELAGARGHTGSAAHGTRGEDGVFGPRETATHLLLEMG